MRASWFHSNSPMALRQLLDSLDFAYGGKELHGEVPWLELPRLRDVLVDSAHNHAQKLNFTLRGYRHKNDSPMLALTLSGACELICQRCLQKFLYSVNLTHSLLLVTDEKLSDLAIEDEPAEVDSIVASTHLDVLDLLEEEFLLSLPFAPKHADESCENLAALGVMDAKNKGVVEVTKGTERNPFAALAGLKLK